VVEGDQATHSFASVKGKDAEGCSRRHRLVTPWHCHDHHHNLPNRTLNYFANFAIALNLKIVLLLSHS
jgi:hypothetical protein